MDCELSEYKYKIETHCHTSPVSPCADFSAEQVIKTYKDAGVDAVVITNHFTAKYIPGIKTEAEEYYLRDYYDAKNAGEKYGVRVILGMEIRFEDQNHNDYMVFGIDEGFVGYAFDFLHSTLEEAYPKLKNDKNLIIQAHPKRAGIEPANPDYIDGIEAFNMHPGHNNAPSLTYKYALEHPEFIVTAGSDYHHAGHEAGGLILSKTLPSDSFELADILKSRDYLFSLGGCPAIPYI